MMFVTIIPIFLKHSYYFEHFYKFYDFSKKESFNNHIKFNLMSFYFQSPLSVNFKILTS